MTAPLSPDRNRWRCAKCGAVFEKWAPMQRHSNDTGHARVEIVWGEGD